MKVIDIKNSYKTFIRNLINEHDDEAYTAQEVIDLCEKHGYGELSNTQVTTVLKQYASRIKHENTVYWGNETAIAQIRGCSED